jgi:hypothetical protein
VLTLDKWYLDLVTPGGDAFIGYSARLRWLGLRIAYQSFLFSPAVGRRLERTTLRKASAPIRSGAVVEWRNARLGIAGRWCGQAPALRLRLLESESASIRWICHQPRAAASVTLPNGGTMAGDGYVERLRVEMRHALPFDTLHWGRFHGDGETLLWISWDAGAAGLWVFRNGVLQHGAVVTNEAITGLDGGSRLGLGPLRRLRDRSVPRVLARLRVPGGSAAAMLRTLRERKWVGRGDLADASGTTTSGWLIHEEVSWQSRTG